jgi:hypothetical protein
MDALVQGTAHMANSTNIQIMTENIMEAPGRAGGRSRRIKLVVHSYLPLQKGCSGRLKKIVIKVSLRI